MSIEVEIQKIINKHSNLDPLSELEKPTPLVKELAELFNKQKKQTSDKWDKLNKEFEAALERFDEWTPKKRTPIEAAKHEGKIREFAIEYSKEILESENNSLIMFCQRDFMAGFYKCHELQLQNQTFAFTKEQLVRAKSLQLLDKFISETPKEELDALIKKYHGSNEETEITDTETPIAKLRNQLSPYYSLPDMVLALDIKPEIKPILMEQAKIAKQTNERIKELLIEIEGHQTEEKEFPSIQKSVLDSFFEENNNDLQGYIKVAITMHDYDNWNNGDYKGKMHEVVPHLMEKIKIHTIKFAEYLHKYYPNIYKPENYREVPIKEGERVWMKAFFADDYGKELTTTELYEEFLNYLKNKK